MAEGMTSFTDPHAPAGAFSAHQDSPGNDLGRDEQPDAPQEPKVAKAAARPAPRPDASARKAGLDAAAIAKVLDKMDAVSGAAPAQRAMLAGILSCADDARTITVAVLSGKSTGTALADINSLIGAKEALAAVTVFTWDRERQVAVWGLLVGLGSASGRYPSVEVKGALALAEAAFSLSDKDAEQLAAVAALAKA